MAICYYCKCEITEKNNSMEHIIPNVLRGKLKSKNVLCKECNNGLSSIDKSLSNNFEFLNIFIETKTDRPIDLKVPVKIDGKDAILKSGMKYIPIFKPKIERKGDVTQFSFEGIFASNDKEEKKKLLKKIQECLKNNGKDISIDEIEKCLKTTESIPQIENKSTFNLDDIILGYLKIALGFCSFKNKIQYVQEDIFGHFKNFDFNNFKHFIRLIDNNKLKNGRLCNHIYLVGDKMNCKLFCVVSIFNYIDIGIILNENYHSESFQENYIFDLIDSEEIQEHINFSFDEIKNNKFDFNKIRKNYISDINYVLKLFSIYQNIYNLIFPIFSENIKAVTKNEKKELEHFIKNRLKEMVEKYFCNINNM